MLVLKGSLWISSLINIFHSHLDRNNEYHSMAGIYNIVTINNIWCIMKNEILFHSVPLHFLINEFLPFTEFLTRASSLLGKYILRCHTYIYAKWRKELHSELHSRINDSGGILDSLSARYYLRQRDFRIDLADFKLSRLRRRTCLEQTTNIGDTLSPRMSHKTSFDVVKGRM
jgi:hypothetical protein